MKFGFGMKIEDLQLARKMVEDATQLRADEKEHVDVGGIYYQFLGPGGEELTLVRNFDQICAACTKLLPRMLPPGAKLEVVTPTGSQTFAGRISP